MDSDGLTVDPARAKVVAYQTEIKQLKARVEELKFTAKQCEMIQECLGTFDFVKVQKVMEYLDWQWVPIGGVPSVCDLVDEATRLMRSLVNKPSTEYPIYTECGGFRVEYTDDEYGQMLSLKFVLEGWDAEVRTKEEAA